MTQPIISEPNQALLARKFVGSNLGRFGAPKIVAIVRNRRETTCLVLIMSRILVTALRRRLEYLHPVSGSGISTTIIKRRAQQITFNESGSVARRTENHRILKVKLQRTITAVTSATTGSEWS